MAFDKDLYILKAGCLGLQREGNFDSDVKRDRINFFVWELKFLESFLGLQSFTFANECGMLSFTQKMQEIWKTLYAALVSDSHADSFDVQRNKMWNTKLEFRSKYSYAQILSIPLSPNKDDIPNPEFVIEFIDVVAENLTVLLQINDPCSLLFVPGPKEQIEDVLKELKLLRLFASFVSDKCVEPQSQHTIFTYVLIEASHVAIVAWLYLPSHGNENQDLAPNEMNMLLSDLLQMKIKQPEISKFYIGVLQALKSTLIQSNWHPNIQNEHAADSGSMETPAHNFVELTATVSNPSWVVSLNHQMAILQGKEDTTLEDVNRTLGLDLARNNIQPIKAMIYLIIRKVFQSNLPRIHGLGYVDFLLNLLKEFQSRYSNSLAFVMNQIQMIQKELESAQPFLEDVAKERHNKHGGLLYCATRLIGKAYEVEYVVDACIRKDVPHWCLERWLLDITEEITRIRAQVGEVQGKKMLNPVSHDTMKAATDHESSQLAKTPRMEEEIVGLEDVRKELRDKLTKGCRELDVISIVGMPGLGKTTLAKKLYSDESVVGHFDICAQCCVSQVYDRVNLLLSILSSAIGERPNVSTESDVAEKLRRSLMVKRYLILVDDVWEASAWDDLSSCFYDAKNGSRIILTTRHLEVANYATFVSKPIPLRMLNDEESWKLLHDKVFGKENCSPLFEEVGRQIAKKCGGLPLSIVLVAGILAKMEKKEESWKQVAITLGSHIHKDSEAIVEQSYQDLPCHLKPCFLYFGSFLEDRVINVSRLTRLWTSEGFTKSCEGKSLEDIAQGYLENLIGRNLVMAAQRTDLDGKVETCRIHDLLLEFCKKKATEENLLLWIKWDQNANPSSCIYSHKQHAQCRLASSVARNLEELSSSCTLVSSVLFRNDTEFFALHGISFSSLTISLIFHNFKFLKVLDLEDIAIGNGFPTELVYLRYFSAGIRQESIQSSIANLWNLETLILNNSGVLSLPATVWQMVKLRHLHISYSFNINNAEGLVEDSSELYDLRTLSTPFFSCVKDAEFVLRKIPNIQELQLDFKGVSNGQFPVLDFPTRLEKLHIYHKKNPVRVPYPYPVCISASNLKDLTVTRFRVGLQHLSNIAQLQNLQALELDQVEFDDKVWEVNYDEFPQLKVLKLYCDEFVEEWTVSDDAFPNFERLVLCHCWNLKEIPSCFADISSLEYIELSRCSESVVKSARDICEKQVEDYQNSGFKLLVKEYPVTEFHIPSSLEEEFSDESVENSARDMGETQVEDYQNTNF